MKPIRRLSSVFAYVALILVASQPAAAALDPSARSAYAARLADNAAGRFDTSTSASTSVNDNDRAMDAVIQWDRLRRDGYTGSLGEYTAFLKAHPGWPGQATLRRHAEKIIDATTPAADRIAFFTAFAPLSALGKLRYAEGLAMTGKPREANLMARDAWASSGLDASSENDLLARFASVITPDDSYERFDRLLWTNQSSAAARLLPRLPGAVLALAQARLAVRQGSPNADAMRAGLPAAQQFDTGLTMDRVTALKRSDPLAARALMASATAAQGSVVDAELWLKTRAEFARAALKEGDTATAYRLAANHNAFALGRGLNERSLGERQAYIDAEFIAGWTALRRLNRASAAIDHFQNVRAAALTPVSQARGDYWTGRAAQAAGKQADAERYYTAAAAHPDYFYGQLAAERLGNTLSFRKSTLPPVAPDKRAAFLQDDLVRATQGLGDIDARALQTVFMKALVERADTTEQARLVADLAGPLGRPDLGVLMGKAARAGGELSLVEAAFPRVPLPPELDPSWTMIHAIARQESQFDRAAASGANARGLMQLLPGTAQETAIKIGQPFNISRLSDDPVYNATLGAAYYERVRQGFGGSHVLAVAAYNAGPGNARKFITANGDPRDSSVDIVDWIELIPLSETRTYVQRVLENAVVYDMLEPGHSRMPTVNRLSAYLGKKEPG